MKKINLGILGGGQLGCMLCMAAKKLNVYTIVWSDDPMLLLQKNFLMNLFCQIITMNEKIDYFTKNVDKITFEFENIPF